MNVFINIVTVLQVSNVTFSDTSCTRHSVELSVPGQEVSLHKECGQSLNKKINISGPDLKLGLIQVHLKMKDLASGAFTVNWKYE